MTPRTGHRQLYGSPGTEQRGDPANCAEKTAPHGGRAAGTEFDPRLVYVRLEGGSAYVSVPLRSVGRGLAVIDTSSIDLRGVALGSVSWRTARRQRVPVGETTRIEVIACYQVGVPIDQAEDWCLHLRYTDFAGEQPAHAAIRLGCPDGPQGPWYIVDVDHELRSGQEEHQPPS